MSNKIKVWTRLNHPHCVEWKLVWTNNPGNIPENCVKMYNRVFWKMHERGVLFPLDELAAYQEGMLALIEANDKIQRGAVTLTTCKPTTYIIASGVMRLRQFHREEVSVTREQYRELGDMCRANECDLQALAEALSDMGHAADAESRTLAAHCVDETLALCHEETQRALRAYMKNDLNAYQTAKELKMAYATFAWRRDNLWFPDFRRHCFWEW